jgi:UDPglucose--hexose-1-phosphate uridylyltransferase
VLAPGRAERPGAARVEIEPPSEEELASCPFCAGREDRTPPETLRLPQAPDWTVRVVPNLYPALGGQEVVVHSPRHVRSLAELADTELDLLAEAWQRRRAAVRDGYLHALVNEGRGAGASLAHSHSQLTWLPEPPPVVDAERGPAEGEAVLERDGLVAVCPHASRLPYEVQVAPERPEPEGLRSDLLAPGLRLVAELVRRLRELEGAVPLNVWLHEGRSWHLELVPRLTVLAGLELGAGVYVNTLAPSEAAAALRSGAPRASPSAARGTAGPRRSPRPG